MSFTTDMVVRFAHVDAAAIVFYPRYFEMLNGAVEDWFAAMGCDFRRMHMTRRMGVPTVRLESQFVAPSSLGDVLTISLSPQHLSTSSCALDFTMTSGGRDRVRGAMTLVCMNLDLQKSMPWPDALRSALEAHLGAP